MANASAVAEVRTSGGKAKFRRVASAIAGAKNTRLPATRRGASAPSPLKYHRSEAYLLAQRGHSVYLVRRAPREKVMPGMWELPRLPAPPSAREPLFRLKHSITVTNYDIAVFPGLRRTPPAGMAGVIDATSSTAAPKNETRSSRRTPVAGVSDAAYTPGGGRWVALERILELPLTGLTRKVLRQAKLIQH